MARSVPADETDVDAILGTLQPRVSEPPARRSLSPFGFGAKTAEGVVTYEALLTVDNAELALRPGMTATATIVVDQIDNALLVPAAALRFTPPRAEAAQEGRGLVGALLPRPPRPTPKPNANARNKGKSQQVWVLREGQPHPVAITIGATNGLLTVVTSGDLAAGMPVITDTVTVK